MLDFIREMFDINLLAYKAQKSVTEIFHVIANGENIDFPQYTTIFPSLSPDGSMFMITINVLSLT